MKMARSDEKMEQNWEVKGNNILSDVHKTESALKEEIYETLL
jgi:hypothetical protein